jgi:hypothetical protein
VVLFRKLCTISVDRRKFMSENFESIPSQPVESQSLKAKANRAIAAGLLTVGIGVSVPSGAL